MAFEVTFLLTHPKPSVRTQACDALGRMGGAVVQPYLDAVAKLLGDDDAQVRKQSGRTLAVIGPLAAPAAAAMLKDPRPDVKRAAAAALDQLGTPAAAGGRLRRPWRLGGGPDDA